MLAFLDFFGIAVFAITGALVAGKSDLTYSAYWSLHSSPVWEAAPFGI